MEMVQMNIKIPIEYRQQIKQLSLNKKDTMKNIIIEMIKESLIKEGMLKED